VWSAAFALSTAMAVTVYRLMSLLEAGLPALWAMPIFVPVVNLLTLLVISQKMQGWCRKRRIYVGLLGPATESIEWVRRG
jgi:putative effector of murein hydrolase